MQSSEQSLRVQVAAATLLLNDFGILGYSGHIGARLPGRDEELAELQAVLRGERKFAELPPRV
jgi:hypothetical protein